MSKYIAKRIIYFIPVLFGIVFLVYSIMYLAPGDPARMILGDKVPQAQVDALREEMGLNKPFLVQFYIPDQHTPRRFRHFLSAGNACN